MVDVTVKNVPSGAEDKVKEMACIACERYLRNKDVDFENIDKSINPKTTYEKFKKDVDAIRTANGLSKKFEELEEKEV